MKKKSKQLFAGMLSAVMTLSALPLTTIHGEDEVQRYPYTFFAGSSEEGAITINANNVCINGNIATNGTITSTSANFNVNGTITENAAETTIQSFKKINNFYFNSSEVETYFEDYFLEDTNINVNTPIEAEGDIELIGNINISSGLKALNDVNLSGNVENTQNSAICSETGDIIINTENVNLSGLVYAPNGNVNISAMNLNINGVVIIADTITINCPSLNANYSASMGDFIGTESEVELDLFAYGEYDQETDMFEVFWESTVPKGIFEVQSSDNGENFKTLETISDADSTFISFNEDFDKKYIKVIEVTSYNEVCETIPFIIKKVDDCYEVDLLDSDGDCLADIYELEYGTDIYDIDTDDDGLSDYLELIFLKTDPLKYDSVTEGISDAYADSDDDGLQNIVEIDVGSDPTIVDTDADGLTDYEEYIVYSTNPLIIDTDNDGMIDKDEVSFNLNPLNPRTNGVLDSEYPIMQTINGDSYVFSQVNTEDSPYLMSISINTNGNAEDKIEVKQSKYNSALGNSTILGYCTDVIFDDECNFDNTALEYKIKDEFISDPIQNYIIFKYYDELGVSLPLKTEYDIDNNEIKANIYSSGTYYVVNIDQWYNMLKTEVPFTEYITENTDFSIDENLSLELPPVSFNNNISILANEPKSEDNNEVVNRISPIDVVFLVNCSSATSSNEFENILKNIEQASLQLFEESISAQISIIAFGYESSRSVQTLKVRGKQWASSYTDILSFLSQLRNLKSENNTDDDFENALTKLLNEYTFRNKVSKFAFLFVPEDSWGESTLYRAYKDINISDLIKSNSNYWIDRQGRTLNYDSLIFKRSGGKSFCYNSQFSSDIVKHIKNNTKNLTNAFYVRLSHNFKYVYLDDVLSPYNGVCSDGDGWTDWQEVNTKFLKFNDDGTFTLPTFNEYLNAIENEKEKKSIREVFSDTSTTYDNFWNYYEILPVISDPTLEDTDGDGMNDDKDPHPLIPELNENFNLDKAVFDSLDSYLNTLMPPTLTKDGKKIKLKNAETCDEVKIYFEKIILPYLIKDNNNLWLINDIGYNDFKAKMFHNWIKEIYATNKNESISDKIEKHLIKGGLFLDAISYDIENNGNKVLNQVIYGNYSSDVTLMGTYGQILISFSGIDFIADIRDVVYDTTHWKWTWKHAGVTILDAASLLPLVGSLKYSDEISLLTKIDYNAGIKAINNAVPELLDNSGNLVKNYGEVANLIKSKALLQIVSKPDDAAQLSKLINKYGIKAFGENDKIIKSVLKVSDEAAELFMKTASEQDSFYDVLLDSIKDNEEYTDLLVLYLPLCNTQEEAATFIEMALKYDDDYLFALSKMGEKFFRNTINNKYSDYTFKAIMESYTPERALGLIDRKGKEAAEFICWYGADAEVALMNYENNVSGYSNLDDIKTFVSEEPFLLKQLGNFEDYTSDNYAKIFRRAHGINGLNINNHTISDNFEVHHCFPKSIFKEGGIGEEFLIRTKININDPRLLVWWEKDEHGSKASEYNKAVIDLILFSESDEEIIEGIRNLMQEKYGFKVQF